MDPNDKAKTPDDEFEAAFAQISAADNANSDKIAAANAKGENTPKDIETPGAVDAAAAEKIAADTAAAEKVAADAAAAKAAEGEQTPEQKAAADAEAAKVAADAEKQRAATAAAANPKVTDEEFVNRFLGAIEKVADTKGAAKTEPTPAKPEYTAEEDATIAKFVEDFPDINAGSILQRRGEYKFLMGHMFSEVRKTYDGIIRELVDTVQTLVNRTQAGDIRTIEPNYDTIRDQVVDWVGKQPKWLQPGLAHVIREGTVDEVQQLIGMWKESTGYKPAGAASDDPAKASADAEAARVAAAANAAKTERAAAALAPTPAKRSNAVLQAEPQTFDDAFAAFSAAEAAKDAATKR